MTSMTYYAKSSQQDGIQQTVREHTQAVKKLAQTYGKAFGAEIPAALCALFFDTVHTVCAKDYTEQQCDAWAPREFDCAALCGRLASSYALVAECGGALAGFANLGEDGYFDCLYVSSQMQGRGVATALADAMERRAAQQGASRMVSDVSITARPFFEHRGYRVVQEQTVVRHGVAMTNYHMEKVLP